MLSQALLDKLTSWGLVGVDLDNFNLTLLAIFAFLALFASSGLLLLRRPEFKKKPLFKHCPCSKLAQNGLLSSLCLWAAIGGLFYAGTGLGLIGLGNLILDGVFLLSLILAGLGWALKRE